MLTRRSTLRLAAGLTTAVATLGTSSCGTDVAVPGAGPAAGPAAGSSGDRADPDVVLLDAALAATRTRVEELAAARQARPALRDPFAALEALHRAHLAALTPGGPGPGADPGPAPVPAPGRAGLLRRERAHLQVLRDAALTARSGALARLLASAAAGQAGHLAALTGDPGPVVPAASSLPDPVLGTTDPAGVEAWQDTLAAEHAAVYVWGLLGARTSESAAPEVFDRVRDAYLAHRDRRDDLVGQVAATGATPRPAATAYVAPPGLEDTAGVSAAGVGVEQATASSYAALVASTSGPARAQAIDWLTDSSIRVLALRGTPEMFPGADEYADR